MSTIECHLLMLMFVKPRLNNNLEQQNQQCWTKVDQLHQYSKRQEQNRVQIHPRQHMILVNRSGLEIGSRFQLTWYSKNEKLVSIEQHCVYVCVGNNSRQPPTFHGGSSSNRWRMCCLFHKIFVNIRYQFRIKLFSIDLVLLPL